MKMKTVRLELADVKR